jgi:signal transduction histidine kinase
MRTPGASRRDLLVDCLLAVALLALSLALVGAIVDGDGERAVAASLAAAHNGALAWRRRRPLLVLAAMIATAVLAVVSGLPVVILGPGALLAAYTVGAETAPPVSTIALGATAVATAITVLASGMDLSTVVGDVVGLGVAWRLGDRGRRAALRHVAEQAAAAEATRRAAADERLRIARELHDVVAHAMSVIAVQAGTGRYVIDDSPDVAREALANIEVTSRDALQEMRRLLAVLRDDADDVEPRAPAPGIEDLGALAEATTATGIEVEVRSIGRPVPLPAGVELAAYRIVQEALTNVRRHSRASRATVTLRFEPGALGVEIVDDGRGSNGSGAGHGIAGMRERAALYGGCLDTSFSAAGFRVVATLPLAEPA